MCSPRRPRHRHLMEQLLPATPAQHVLYAQHALRARAACAARAARAARTARATRAPRATAACAARRTPHRTPRAALRPQWYAA